MAATHRPAGGDRKPGRADAPLRVLAAGASALGRRRLGPKRQNRVTLTQLFGFVQLDFAGTLDVPDGRYLARDEAGEQRVLVVETLGAPPPPGRRRRRAREVEPGGSGSGELPLCRVTTVRTEAPFDDPEEAEDWLEVAVRGEDAVEELLAEAVALLNRALHARAIAAADPHGAELDAERAVAARVGYGSGESLAAGRFASARSVDPRAPGSPRSLRERDLRPQERLAAILGGRERAQACETLLLRARADLDAGRTREAALQLRVGLEAMLSELSGDLAAPGHEEDMAQIEARRSEAGEAANEAIRGELTTARERQVHELTGLCERVLRRRRVLRG